MIRLCGTDMRLDIRMCDTDQMVRTTWCAAGCGCGWNGVDDGADDGADVMRMQGYESIYSSHTERDLGNILFFNKK